jgi:hypothetical protein
VALRRDGKRERRERGIRKLCVNSTMETEKSQARVIKSYCIIMLYKSAEYLSLHRDY